MAIVPDLRLATVEAREALPPEVPRADAVFNAAHAALVLEAITRDPGLLTVALRDRLHEDARLSLVPEVADLMDDLRRVRVPACVSGAGPTVLAFETEDGPDLRPILDSRPTWRVLRPGVRAAGFEVVRS